MASKISRMADEMFFGRVDTGRFQSLLDGGWKIVHEKGTAYVSLHHPRGGKIDLLEVKTHGLSAMTVGEADEVARIVAELLCERFEQ